MRVSIKANVAEKSGGINMIFVLKNENYSLNINVDDNTARIVSGFFGEVKLLEAPLFNMRIKELSTSESIYITSENKWEKIIVNNKAEFIFINPEGIADLSVFVKAELYKDGIAWDIETENNNENISVMEISYPAPKMTGEYLDYFIPFNAGKVMKNAVELDFEEMFGYPHGNICMQYFAAYGRKNGIYIGIEDGKGAVKRFKYGCKDGACYMNVDFYGIGASLPANSFKVYGKCRWQFFEGDWYDAAMIYADFVKKEAQWLPEIDENGRPDTAERFKNVPFWISDYIPNSRSQGDNKPMNLSAGSDIYEKEYWYKAPILLQEKLGVPIAYHVYNWHEIPFNIEYPHFLPAKEEFCQHAEELRKNNIYVLPYINGAAWEIHDYEMEHEVNFKNTGSKGAVVKENGDFIIEKYPQKTLSGKTSQLSHMCGSFSSWHKMMENLTREMEKTLPIDGVYFDEISAVTAYPCFNKAHQHLPGGGSYWAEGYNRMMRKINAEKPENNFYFSECNCEAYMKSFDGYLTWMWVTGDEVPAFPAVYAGYIQLLGRCTIGKKKDDFDFFKYCTAKSLLYGQQLGWCKADIVYSDKHIEFLKKAVDVRYKYSKLFNCSKMLRPPVVTTNLPKLVTKAGLWFGGNVVSDYVLGGAWQYRNGKKTVIFAVNISDETAEFTLSFKADEYGVSEKNAPADFKLTEGICNICGKLEKNEIKVWECDDNYCV